MTLAGAERAPEGMPFNTSRKASSYVSFSTLVAHARVIVRQRERLARTRDAVQCRGFASASSYVDFAYSPNPLG